MAKKTRKCQMCKEQGLLEEMQFELVGKTKPVKKYYHNHCYQEFLKEKEFKAKEQMEKDELNEVIKNIYGIKEIPSQAWVLLEKLRGGNPVFGKQNIGKRYKEGYEYPLIKETFEHCSDTIEYWNSVKDFNGFMGAFRYALTIVIDKIYYVEQRMKERESKKKLIEQHTIEMKSHEQEFESNYKKKTSNTTDISDFLDD
ncbi:hypothetical protein PQE75_gp116 [Bacillus phage vB_BcoS-136]|uniref:Uncharacterized protein n=1 Tax=Bacillus phage vB_BcoS-136 TaxID=2419619 RepID=A0A3G3BVU2_9CAUD|nr:hypothetical protein PQE75_gp116 [Bacillus phage vB_BcoS-136]AYP68363.1 hypothetical protein vBBcoS136_00249 [Bacillus phage vB_BcoS-136]